MTTPPCRVPCQPSVTICACRASSACGGSTVGSDPRVGRHRGLQILYMSIKVPYCRVISEQTKAVGLQLYTPPTIDQKSRYAPIRDLWVRVGWPGSGLPSRSAVTHNFKSN
eukprot:4806568-Prymnesium_polylepis.1